MPKFLEDYYSPTDYEGWELIGMYKGRDGAMPVLRETETGLVFILYSDWDDFAAHYQPLRKSKWADGYDCKFKPDLPLDEGHG